MEIDISKPEGNTMVALSIATRLMRAAERDKADILALQKAVFGSITFVDGRED